MMYANELMNKCHGSGLCQREIHSFYTHWNYGLTRSCACYAGVWETGGRDPVILNLDIKRRWAVSFTPPPLDAGRRIPGTRYPLHRKLDGPHSLYGCSDIQKNFTFSICNYGCFSAKPVSNYYTEVREEFETNISKLGLHGTFLVFPDKSWNK